MKIIHCFVCSRGVPVNCNEAILPDNADTVTVTPASNADDTYCIF